MLTAFTKLLDHTQKHFSNCQVDKSSQTIGWMITGDNGMFRLVVKMDNLLRVCAFALNPIPAGARPLIAQGVCRANFGLPLGKFEFDMDKGRLLFSSAMILDGDLTDEVIGQMIMATVGTLDDYLPSFMSVIYANEPPKEAVERIERDLLQKDD